MNEIDDCHNSNLNYFSLIHWEILKHRFVPTPGLLASSVSLLVFSPALFWREWDQLSIFGRCVCTHVHVCVYTTDMLHCRLSLFGNCIWIVGWSSWSGLSARNSKLEMWPLTCRNLRQPCRAVGSSTRTLGECDSWACSHRSHSDSQGSSHVKERRTVLDVSNKIIWF